VRTSFVTSQGSAFTRFRRALDRANVIAPLAGRLCREVDVSLEKAPAVLAVIPLAGERTRNAALALAELLSRRGLEPSCETLVAWAPPDRAKGPLTTPQDGGRVQAGVSQGESLMRRTRFPAIVLLTLASLIFATSAFAASVTDRASLTRDGKVTFDTPITARVNMHTRFASVKRVCFAFTFKKDVLDPGEEWSLAPRVNGFEMLNASTFPISGVSFCLLPDNALVDRFRDGRAKLLVAIKRQGSMRIAELDVTVRGAPRLDRARYALAGG
jgi:hypothetical protein